MNIEAIRTICKSLRGVTEDVKWKNDLCFMVGGKMFCVACLVGPITVAFKVRDEEFAEISALPGIRPAPYVARYKWVQVEDVHRLSKKEWEHYIKQSYDLVKVRLSKKILKKHKLVQE